MQKKRGRLGVKLQMGLSENRVYLKGHYIILSIVYKYYIDINWITNDTVIEQLEMAETQGFRLGIHS